MMSDIIKQRVLDAVNRVMLYCLRVTKEQQRIITVFGNDKPISIDELYDTIISIRSVIPNKDEARILLRLAEDEHSYCAAARLLNTSAQNALGLEKRVAKLKPILEKLGVLCGQT